MHEQMVFGQCLSNVHIIFSVKYAHDYFGLFFMDISSLFLLSLHFVFTFFCSANKHELISFPCSGSGKTYTMQPLPLKASEDILRLMHNTYRNQGFQLFVSFFEIYGGKLFDLLNDRR